MITIEEAKEIVLASLDSFLLNNDDINGQQLQAECINNACLYYLKEKHKAYSGLNALRMFNPFDKIEPTEVGRIFGEATKLIVPQYNDAMVANASLAVLQNSQWEGMWEFLEKYFEKNHKLDINFN